MAVRRRSTRSPLKMPSATPPASAGLMFSPTLRLSLTLSNGVAPQRGLGRLCVRHVCFDAKKQTSLSHCKNLKQKFIPLSIHDNLCSHYLHRLTTFYVGKPAKAQSRSV